MAKRDRARKRKAKRAQEESKQQKTQMMMIGAFVLVIVAVIGYIGFFSDANEPLQATERLLLDPVLGNPDAPITVEEWAAFACPSCKAVHEQGIIDTVLERYPGQVKFVFRDFPVISPSYDRAAAEVAQCAFDQGNEQFWLLHDWLYTDAVQGRTTQNEIIQAGGSLGMDVAELQSCVESNVHEETVLFDLQRAYAQNFNGTPTFVVNGQRMFSIQQVVETIESEIVRLGL
ncbi:MAG: thioredoxin domain-containing protein [Anaerolineae bacterium]|nr:thioredoxin domain-containing protein [Anaerolineae bacterium]MDQ7034066.1 thioredoxin domain-containing protein [Anaerolineae bacterium]